MSEPYTDRYGYPLTVAQAARRLASPRSAGFYHNGRWIQRKPRMAKEPAAHKKDNKGDAA